MQNLSQGICRVEDVLEMVEKFCYLGGMFSLYGGASDVDNSGKGSAFKKFRESSRVLAVKQGLSLK